MRVKSAGNLLYRVMTMVARNKSSRTFGRVWPLATWNFNTLEPTRYLHRASVAMDTIPEELLAEIFTWCQLGPFPEHNPFRPETIPLLNVCRVWRRIALSTPSLWCSIDILPFRPIDKLPQYLSLSKGTLLDVRLGSPSILGWLPLDYLLAEMHRIRSLTVTYLINPADVVRLADAMDLQ